MTDSIPDPERVNLQTEFEFPKRRRARRSPLLASRPSTASTPSTTPSTASTQSTPRALRARRPRRNPPLAPQTRRLEIAPEAFAQLPEKGRRGHDLIEAGITLLATIAFGLGYAAFEMEFTQIDGRSAARGEETSAWVESPTNGYAAPGEASRRGFGQDGPIVDDLATAHDTGISPSSWPTGSTTPPLEFAQPARSSTR